MGSQHFYAEPRSSVGQRDGWTLFAGVKELASWSELSSDEHFSIDGTLLDAWASHKSFVRKDGDSNPPDDDTRNPSRDFFGEKRSNATHESITDPGARLGEETGPSDNSSCRPSGASCICPGDRSKVMAVLASATTR